MPYIDITSMGGEMPRIIPAMLPDRAATLAENCHFRFGVVTPVMETADTGKAFAIKPQTIFHYRDNFWFAWPELTDVIRSPVAQDPYGRVYYTDGQYPKVTSAAIATKGDGNYPSAFFRLGVPAPSAEIVCTVSQPQNPGDDDPTDDETRFYTETYVTDYGEEGPPGPASQKVVVTYPGSSVDLQLQAPPLQNSNITRRRIYRSASGGGEADFLLVAELAASVLSYRDEVSSDALGPAMQTWHYMPPPSNMQGLCLMANGIAAGFAGNEVMFSEAFLPYAWPDSYRQTTEDDIVAIAPVGTALVVATKGEPYLFSGVSPANISGMKLPQTQACISRSSMVAMDGFVLYAGTNGLVSVDGNGNAVNATEKIISPEQWNTLFNPSSIRAYLYRGEYVARYTKADGSHAVFIFNPQDMDIRYMNTSFDAAYHQMESDTLYLVSGNNLVIFQGGTKPVPFRWRSKKFVASEGTGFACLRIVSRYPERVGVTLYTDGRQALQLPPGSLSSGVLKLPPMTGTEWEIEVSGFARVERLTLSTSMEEMPA
ncbi:TPA: hypothetical protein ACTALY_000084 [Salmonella enterica subsp. enterica serovar Muenchen]|nr:hypothetical protein [Salmonella enterica subsp. enterica serovar Muenchen]HEC8684648.1 hypothetical protein [Salmonella enterica subsp. enterica serovar Oranienburg]HEC9706623.1 hypothetical protein [Salmonella enterica subsp. enterica serovar Muenchen]HED0220313.1 hypothetical protein [Salmonella enterica subsp. enterica serovar Muenchen]